MLRRSNIRFMVASFLPGSIRAGGAESYQRSNAAHSLDGRCRLGSGGSIKSSVLKNKDKFGKHDSGPAKDDAGAREEMKHMGDKPTAEKAKPGAGSAARDK
jgi:hypothetical protein